MKNQSLARGQVRQSLLVVIRYFPYVFLWIDAISLYLYDTDYYPDLYMILLSVFGHSIGWVVYTSLILYLLRVCLYTWICMATLLSINVLNMYPVSDKYYSTYANIIIFAGILMSTVLILRSCSKTRYTTL